MPLPSENIERELALLCLNLDLQQHPDKAKNLAVNYYEDYTNLTDAYKMLRREFEALQIENIRLKSSDNSTSPRLPSFLNSKSHEVRNWETASL